MRIYLAARYSRRLELCGYRDRLQMIGHVVQAVWLGGSHQIGDHRVPIREDGEALVERGDGFILASELRQKFAHENFLDIGRCDLLISFTEPPRSNESHRHVELGIALGMMKQVIVVGYRENLFCWHKDIRFCETADEAIALLERPEL